MVGEARRLRRTLGVAYYRRFYPKLLKAKELIAAGAIGRPLLAELIHHVWLTPSDISGDPWHFDPAIAGGGPLYDVGSHRIDVLNFLFGTPARSQRLALPGRPAEQSGRVGGCSHRIDRDGVRGLVDVSWRSPVRATSAEFWAPAVSCG